MYILLTWAFPDTKMGDKMVKKEKTDPEMAAVLDSPQVHT
jgi:hypothetical protein